MIMNLWKFTSIQFKVCIKFLGRRVPISEQARRKEGNEVNFSSDVQFEGRHAGTESRVTWYRDLDSSFQGPGQMVHHS